MPAPKLSIPVSANLDKFKEAMNSTSTLARQATKKVLDEFISLNAKLGGPIAAGLGASFGKSILGVAGKIALVVGAFKLMGDAVDAVRGQLKEMADIADKAASTNFSPEFWQSWVNGAKGAEKQVELFEGALNNAFQALKPVLNPDWSVWDIGLKKVTSVETAMREMRELFTTDQDFSGFTLFKNATSQDQQTAAILTYMKQLQSIGQDVAALDLGDKLFGSRFTDQIRNGTLSVDQLLDDIKTKSADSFSNETVKRAKDLDDQLKNAWQTVSQNLHPSLEALDNLFLDFKSAWVSIVELMAKAAELSNHIRPVSGGGPSNPVSALDLDKQTSLQQRLTDQGLTATQRSGLEAQLREVQSRIAKAEASQVPEAPTEFGFGGTAAIPLPKRRPTDAPAPPKDTGTGVDRFGTSADAIEKRTAAIAAEAAAIDLGTQAREKSRVTAQLETVAKQANAAAGLGENVVTAEQRKVIDEVAAAYGGAALAMEKAKVAASIKFNKETAFLTQEDVAIASQLKGIYPDVATALSSVEAAGLRAANGMRELSNIGQDVNRGLFVEFGQNLRNGATAWDAFRQAGVNALGKIADKLMQMAADNLWKNAFGTSSGGGIGGFISGLFGGGSAPTSGLSAPQSILPPIYGNGTNYHPGGLAIVGDKGPELVNLPRGSQVVANDNLKSLGGITVRTGDTNINIKGNADETTLALMQAQLAKRDAELSSKVVAAVQDAKKRRILP